MFQSQRLICRAIEDSDHAFVLKMHHDTDALVKSTPLLPIPQGTKHAKEHLESFAKCMLAALICLPPSGMPGESVDQPIPVGIVTLKDANFLNGRHFRSAKLGVNIAEEGRGKGYGTEAVTWMLEWAFRQAALHKVTTYVYEYNLPSIKLCEKVGFKLDGRLRDDVWSNGRFWDDLIFSILEDEWRARYDAEKPPEVSNAEG